MSEPLSQALGPPAFRFHPASGEPLQGAAFSPVFKLLATAMLLGTAGWFAHLWLGGKVSGGAVSILSWFLAALGLMACTWWSIVRSVTRLGAGELNQTWLWHKKMALRDLAYAKLIRVRGLDWLVAPRLYLRTLDGKFAVFHAADPRMIAQFERLVAELTAFRRLG